MTETEVLKERERLVREAEERKQLSYVEKVIQINPKKTSILQSKEKKTKQIPTHRSHITALGAWLCVLQRKHA